jgi:heat shock protein HslJ
MAVRLLALTTSALLSLTAACAGAPESPDLDRPSLAPSGDPPAALTGLTWEWVGFQSPVEVIEVDTPDRYTLTFLPGGRVSLRADCNRGSGAAGFPADRRIEVKPLALTRAMCSQGSLSDRYLRELGRAASWFIRDGQLYLELPVDSGTLRFRRGHATPDPSRPQIMPPQGQSPPGPTRYTPTRQ